MTEKLYENDSLLRDCQATVWSWQEKKEDHYEVILDKTVIFPEAASFLTGGWLDDVPVYHASKMERKSAIGPGPLWNRGRPWL